MKDYNVFICYSIKDVDIYNDIKKSSPIDLIISRFKKDGITFWIGEKENYGNSEYQKEILKALRNSELVLFISSAHFNSDDTLFREIKYVLDMEMKIIAFLLDDTALNDDFFLLNKIEFYKNPNKGLDELAQRIKMHIEEIRIKEMTKEMIKEIWMEGMIMKAKSKEEEEEDLFLYERKKKEVRRQQEKKFESQCREREEIIRNIIRDIRKRQPSEPTNAFSSIFAPAEVKRESRMLVQVYVHLLEETEQVKTLAQESDKNAERRDYIPLQCKLKKGDKVEVQLNIYGESLLKSEKKSIVWQGHFTKCSFDNFVPRNLDAEELSCMTLLTVNDIPVGEMRFITKIVETPRKLNPEIIAHRYNKVFISYAHTDESKVKSFHEGLKVAGIEHFFDRAYLNAGDIYPQVIQDYINSADLFVLFWSENASKSEYVQKERAQALERAFPQVKPQQDAKLSIYPMSIEPRAELPIDMKDNYHFGEI